VFYQVPSGKRLVGRDFKMVNLGQLGGFAGKFYATASETSTPYYLLVGNGAITNGNGDIICQVLDNQIITGQEEKQSVLIIGRSKPTDEEGNSLQSSSEVIVHKIGKDKAYENCKAAGQFNNHTSYLDNVIKMKFGLEPMYGNINGNDANGKFDNRGLLPDWTHYQRRYTHKNLTTNINKFQAAVGGYFQGKSDSQKKRK